MKIKYPTGVEVHGKSLRISFTYKGKRVRETLGIPDTPKNRKLAGELRTAICYKIKTGAFDYSVEFPESKNISTYSSGDRVITYGELANKWIEIKSVEISSSTLKKYITILNAVSNFINTKRNVSTFKTEDILLIRNNLLTSPTLDRGHKTNKIGRTVPTVNNYIGLLRHIFNFAFDNGYISTNIFSSIKPLKKDRTKPDPITQNEFPRLLNAANNEQSRNMLITSVYTGLRPGELCSLAWEDIDFTERTLTVRRNLSIVGEFTFPKTQAGTDRVIYMLDPVIECLKSQMPLTRMTQPEIVNVSTREFGKSREDTCTFVFQPNIVAANGLKTKFYSPGGFGQIWNYLVRKSGIRHRKAYQTRHTYACWMLSAGANPAFIATQMGHASSKMVHDVYGAWMTENDASQIDILNRNAPSLPHKGNGKAINS
ncbi:DUF3596 domain-containing protein [Providencia rettgeri]